MQGVRSYVIVGVLGAVVGAGLVAATAATGRRGNDPCARRVAAVLGDNPCPLPSTAESYTAGVFPNGTFTQGSEGVASGRTAAGIYQVRFPRNVDACVAQVTPAQVGNSQPPDIAFVRLVKGASTDTITVLVTDRNGVDVDSPFHLTVSC
jgi:hypothetical protein